MIVIAFVRSCSVGAAGFVFRDVVIGTRQSLGIGVTIAGGIKLKTFFNASNAIVESARVTINATGIF